MAFDRDINCIGYTRVSTERQAGETFSSIDDQKKAIIERARSLGLTVGMWFDDRGASGATVERREQFRAMISACESSPRAQKSPGVILVLNDSRFGRFPDPDQAAAIRFQLKLAGWHVRFCEADDTEDPTFRPVIRALGSAQASEYRRNIQRNARRGARSTAEQGFWRGRAPYGYRRKVVYPPGLVRVLDNGVFKATNERVALTPEHKIEAPVVQWVFDQYSNGRMSIGTLARHLTKKVPERRWSRTCVTAMLKNPAYQGDVVGGLRNDLNPEGIPSGPYGKQAAHEALVSRETFADVQRRLKRNYQKKNSINGDYLLSGVLRCSFCGAKYTGGGGLNFKFYRCSGGVDLRAHCPGKIGTVGKKIVENAVIDVLVSELGKPAFKKAVERQLDESLERWAREAVGGEGRIAAQLSALEGKKQRLISLMADGTVLRTEGAQQLESLRKSIEGLHQERDQVRFAGARRKVAHSERERLLKVLLDFPSQLRTSEGLPRREIILPWIESAVFDKKTRKLLLGIQPLPTTELCQCTSHRAQMHTTKETSAVIRCELELRYRPGKPVRVRRIA